MLLDLTIVIPTQGRHTLERCLKSMLPTNQNGHWANILVVIDTYKPIEDVDVIESKLLIDGYRFGSAHYSANTSNWGYPQLQYGYELAPTKYIMNIGDDDIFLPGAFSDLQDILDGPYQPKMVKTILNPSPHRGNKHPVILYFEKSFIRSRVTGQNFICPNDSRKGFWWDDFCQMEATVNNWDGQVEWRPELLTSCF